MKITKQVVEDIKRIRLEEGLSQLQLSKLSGYTQMTISTIETGRRKPKLETIEKLADVMGYDIKPIEFEKRGVE